MNESHLHVKAQEAIDAAILQRHTTGIDIWESHPNYPVVEWQYAVENDDTRLGYWEWVADALACDAEERERQQQYQDDLEAEMVERAHWHQEVMSEIENMNRCNR